jgi:ketosteroid isomerase-like protein
MSQENVERMRALAESDVIARTSGEFDSEAAIAELAKLWDPEIELDASEGALDVGGVHVGTDAVAQWWREWYSAWEALRFDYRLVDAGDRVVLLMDMRLRGHATGIEMPAKFAWVIAFRNRLIVQVKLYMSQSRALEAVGLSE